MNESKTCARCAGVFTRKRTPGGQLENRGRFMRRHFCSLDCWRGNPIGATTAQRFESKIRKVAAPGGCWLWSGSTSDTGYGCFNADGTIVLAHRYGYRLFVGEIPDGMTLDHLCMVRNCVNPQHLEPVTMGENTRRARAARRARSVVSS